jgi:hypothetical protein
MSNGTFSILRKRKTPRPVKVKLALDMGAAIALSFFSLAPAILLNTSHVQSNKIIFPFEVINEEARRDLKPTTSTLRNLKQTVTKL